MLAPKKVAYVPITETQTGVSSILAVKQMQSPAHGQQMLIIAVLETLLQSLMPLE